MIFIQSSLGHDLEVTRFSLKANRFEAYGFFEMLSSEAALRTFSSGQRNQWIYWQRQ
eukprot:m.108778 g.108778  ORF g.108778 m.108778 type:complete len:57 (+) comp12821_c0_seq1:3862-4032(+)